MDEIYRDHRIAIRFDNGWSARITHVRGTVVPIVARATSSEGADVCLRRARAEIDRYVSFLSHPSLDADEGV